METLNVWELHKPAPCLLPSLSLSLSVLPSVSLGHFHSVCSSTPSTFVHTTLRAHPICLDKKGLARRSFGNGLGLHQWLNWEASEDVSLALGRCSWRWRGCSFDQNGDCFLFVQTCSLMSTRRDSEDNLQYYFLHTLFSVVLCCQARICIHSSCDSWTFAITVTLIQCFMHIGGVLWHKFRQIVVFTGHLEVKCQKKCGYLNCETVKALCVTWRAIQPQS